MTKRLHSSGGDPGRGGQELERSYGPNIAERQGVGYISEK
jgi:hypothetical protein